MNKYINNFPAEPFAGVEPMTEVSSSVSDNRAAPAAGGEFDVLVPRPGSETAGFARVAGYGIPGAVVWAAFNNSEPYITTVGADGEWEVNPVPGFASGSHILHLTHTISGQREYKKIPFTINPERKSVFELIFPQEGEHSEGLQPIFHGRAPAGSAVEIFSPSHGTAKVSVTSEGRFAHRFPNPFDPGVHSIRITGPDATVLERSFTVEPPMLVIGEKISPPPAHSEPPPSVPSSPTSESGGEILAVLEPAPASPPVATITSERIAEEHSDEMPENRPEL